MYKRATGVESCGVCSQESEKGFFLLSMWICLSCERKMVELDVEDPSYAWYIDRLRGSKVNHRMLSH
ncbi:sigma factor G inhibitor Gin [Salicibibacter cibarius]|uniref:Sigma factor G inhibitor Gin n=1 Tax=Salicibibacter cibarius TaxID=2743000 RepID=A0A7T6YZT0_9BACI|nr:sigma factor G inhibitor Gin [Salicibibacter cibarius]QQK74244.1 sigma factor G inhibitor Gin [Salicibibacter cibarius]